MTNLQLAKRTTHWLLTAMVIIYLLTGFGITEYRIIEPLTFGLLTKNLAQRIHINLEIPFIILLVLHIWVLPLLDRFRLKH
jgi:cellobiose-specific phosphotransferase system component IIC